jgi:putative spermidine/putrescine transport system substrate-binding protein
MGFGRLAMRSANRSSRRQLLKQVPSLALVGALSAPFLSKGWAARKYEGKVIQLQNWGGYEGQFIQKYILDPFQQETGAKIIVENGWTAASVAKLRAQRDDPKLDIVMFDDIGAITAGREGLLEPIDLDAVPNANDVSSEFVMEGKGIGFFVYINSIAYSTQAFSSAPNSWQIIWDPRYKGKVILPSIDSTSIYKVLIIAAIMNGGSQSNLEPGFEAMRRLKPNIHSLSKNLALIAESLRSGDAVLTSWQTMVMREYIAMGYPIGVTTDLKEGIFGTPGCISIVKGHKAERAILTDLMNYALDPRVQEQVVAEYWASPTNRKVVVPEKLNGVALAATGASSKLIKIDLDQFYQGRNAVLDKLNTILLG